MVKRNPAVYDRRTIWERKTFSSTDFPIMKSDLPDADDVILNVIDDPGYPSELLVTWTRKETEDEYNVRIAKYEKRLARSDATIKEQLERAEYERLKEKYG